MLDKTIVKLVCGDISSAMRQTFEYFNLVHGKLLFDAHYQILLGHFPMLTRARNQNWRAGYPRRLLLFVVAAAGEFVIDGRLLNLIPCYLANLALCAAPHWNGYYHFKRKTQSNTL